MPRPNARAPGATFRGHLRELRGEGAGRSQQGVFRSIRKEIMARFSFFTAVLTCSLLIKNPLCKKVVVVTRRKTDGFADPKVSEVVVNMDRLGEEVATRPGCRRRARRVRRRQGQRDGA